MNILKTMFFLLILTFTLSFANEAKGFWCKNSLITVGDNKYEVINRCGEPDYKDFRVEKRIMRDFYRDLFVSGIVDMYPERRLYREPRYAVDEVIIEEWIYNLGPTRFLRYLIFENGRLVNISTGDYGF